MRRALVSLVLLLIPTQPTPSAAAEHEDDQGQLQAVTYRPPVNSPVTDPFRPPATPFGPGNRGLEYGTRPGTPVTAAAGGVVTFAGSVAGARYVTLQHADRLRTTYGPLAGIAPGTAPDQHIEAGQRIGTAGPRLLFTTRLGDAYVDPAIVLATSGTTTPRVRLVPDRPSSG